jgi:CO dehydrogenase nickel-insertion accessory protein CooC1
MAQDKEIVEGSHPGEPGCACSFTNIVNYLVNKQGVYMQQVVKVMDTQAGFPCNYDKICRKGIDKRCIPGL